MKPIMPSLRMRLVAVMGLAYIFVAATTLLASYTVDRQNLHAQLDSRAQGDAAILASGSVGFLTGGSLAPLRTFVGSVATRAQGVTYAVVTDSNGRIIASTRPGDVGKAMAIPLEASPTARPWKTGAQGIAPIVQPGGTVLGLAAVWLSGGTVERDLRNQLYLGLVLGAMGLAIFLLLSLVIAQYILGPLVALSRAARALRRGELSARVPSRHETELSAVAETFNDMARALEERIKHLSFLAVTGSILPNTLRNRNELDPILQEFCRQVDALEAGLLIPGEETVVWHGPGKLGQIPAAVAMRASGPSAVVESGWAVMAVPVLGGAVFVAVRDGARPFLQEEQQVITNFAYQLGIAADNARLFEAQQEALQVKDQFLSIVSHELRTPLTTIKGYAQMLQRKLQDDHQSRRFADNIDAQAARLGRLVDDLLDVTRFARGQFELSPQRMDLRPLLEDVVARFRMVAPNHRLRLDLDRGVFEGEWDRDRLEQVLNNLISNAIKYSPDGGDVVVSTAHREGRLSVDVHDQGVGISEEDQKRLFERFYRGSAEGGPIQGLGLGLYVTHRIVEAHGGSIEVTSSPEKGTTFTVTLPLQPAAAGARR